MRVIEMRIRMLSECLNKRIEENDFIIDEDIVKLSQIMDNYIVKHEKLKLYMKQNN